MFRSAIFFCLCVFVSSKAFAADALTLEQVLAKVNADNPTIQAAREGLKATQELYPQAMAGWHPNVNAETSITSTEIESGNFNSGDGATTKSASINMEQPLFRGFRTTGESESSKRRIDAGMARVRQAEQDVFLRTTQAYMDVIRDRMLLDLHQKNKGVLLKETDAAVARFEAGDITQTDVKQTEARFANAQADEAIAQSNLRESEAVFEEMTGIFPPDYMALPVLPFTFPQTMADLIAKAGGQNPQLARSRNEHQAAQSDVTVAKSNFYPQVAAFASYIRDYDPQPGIVDESETSTVGLRARINLYEGGGTVSRTREAKYRANQRLIEIREAERMVKSDLVSNWRRYGAYDVEIAARELEVAATQFSAEGVREEARIGERTILDTLEAEQEVLDAQSSLVEARRNKVLTGYRLAAALGMLTSEQLKLNK